MNDNELWLQFFTQVVDKVPTGAFIDTRKLANQADEMLEEYNDRYGKSGQEETK